MYDDMLLYFGEQDKIHLLKERLRYQIGDTSMRCYKGNLKPSGQKELTESQSNNEIVKRTIAITEKLSCDYSGSIFEVSDITMV